VFEHPKKKVDAQVIDEVGSSTIMGCGFDLIRVGDPTDVQGVYPNTPSTCSSSLFESACCLNASTGAAAFT